MMAVLGDRSDVRGITTRLHTDRIKFVGLSEKLLAAGEAELMQLSLLVRAVVVSLWWSN
jgi:hypothetical protein